MKKIVSLLVVMVLVLGSFSAAFAAEVSPYYVGTARHIETLDISGSGLADFGADLVPKQETSFDRVVITLELVYEDDGSTVYKSVANTTYNSGSASFSKSVTDYQLNKKGDYRLYVTYKCYSNSQLIETINRSVGDTY